MPNAGPQLVASLSLDPAAFERNLIRVVVMAKGASSGMGKLPFKIPTAGITGATKALKGFAATLASIGKGGLSGMGAGFLMGGWTGFGAAIAGVGQKMTSGITDAYDYARSLEILARNTGFSTKSMAVFKVAMEDTGVTMELFQRTSRMIAKEVNLGMHGDHAATAGMEQIGLHVKDLMKLAPEEQFMAVGKAIAAIKNPTMQAAAAVSRFGSESAKMLSFFKNPDALKNAGIAVGEQADIFQRSGKVMERIAVRIGHIKVKAMGFFAGAAETIMPMVDKFSAIFDRMDFSSWGAKLGGAINKALAWMVTFWNEPGKTMAYFWEYAKVEATELGDLLIGKAKVFGEVLGDAILSKFQMLNAFAAIPGGGGMVAGLAKGIAKAAPNGAGGFGASTARERLAAMRPNAAFAEAQKDLGQLNKGFNADKAMWLGQYGNQTKVTDKNSMPASAVRKSAMQKDMALMQMLGVPMAGAGLMAGAGAAFANNKRIKEQFSAWTSTGMQHNLGSAGFGRSSLQGASMVGGLDERRAMQLASPLARGGMSLSGMHQGAYGQSNLMKHGEFERFRSMARAKGLPSFMGQETNRPGETHNGDKMRARAVAIELARKQAHAGTSEQLLSDIAENTDAMPKLLQVFK